MTTTRFTARIRGREGFRDFVVTVRESEAVIDAVRAKRLQTALETLAQLGSVHAPQFPEGVQA